MQLVCIQVCHTSTPRSPDPPPDVAAVSDDTSSIDSSSHSEMSESEGGLWLDHPKVVADGNCNCDLVSVGLKVVDPVPSPPVIARMGITDS